MMHSKQVDSVRWALDEIIKSGGGQKEHFGGVDQFKSSFIAPEKSMYQKDLAVESFMRYKKQ